ncbi:MAG: dTDP-4-dehydrorhamnose 3,5-epimerase family protein [Candidatus Omnitrophica bacterium]|nr:dTDP-4-dehydrorhamnose 3,5-epimerase family protein [Candidatus Omnitrophota bacterium]
MKVTTTELDGVLVIEPDVFCDHRGKYIELYNEQLYNDNGITIKFIQDDISVSKKNVLRGIHGDRQTWKLITCLQGKFFFVVVNCDEESAHFGKWQSFILSEDNRQQILVPPLYGNAHVALSDKVIFHYKQSTYYNRERQFTYAWNDERFNISWPVDNPIFSKRDSL